MSKRIVLGMFFGLSPVAALGQHPPDSPEGPPVRVTAVTCAPGHRAGIPQAPFGYYQTQWRTFPIVEAALPKPAPAAPGPLPAPIQKLPEKKAELPVPPAKPATSGRFAAPSTTVVRSGSDIVPVPHPASINGRTAPKNEKGFASLRPDPVYEEAIRTEVPVKTEPAVTPMVRRIPVVNPGIRQVRGDDEVMRPDWPKLPAAKK